jgi:hypothetical protein
MQKLDVLSVSLRLMQVDCMGYVLVMARADPTPRPGGASKADEKSPLALRAQRASLRDPLTMPWRLCNFLIASRNFFAT